MFFASFCCGEGIYKQRFITDALLPPVCSRRLVLGEDNAMSFKPAAILRLGAALFSLAKYRVPMQVKELCRFCGGDIYPVCPRCGATVEREYMRFCDRCGQRLGWEFFDYTVIVAAPRQRNH